MRASTLPTLIAIVMTAPLLMGLSTPSCDELLERAHAELRREQYPTMLTLAQERQLVCPGAVSRFLAGVAHANMLDKQLVPDTERALVLEQAIAELRGSVPELPPDWRQTALTWISYLEALPESSEASETASTPEHAPTPTEPPMRSHPAAPPWEPDVYPWGPVLLGSAGALSLSAGFVMYLIGSHMESEIDLAQRACERPCRYAPSSRHQLLRDRDTASTLLVASDITLIAGVATVAGALLWYALRHTPSDAPPEIAVGPWLGGGQVGASIRTNF